MALWVNVLEVEPNNLDLNPWGSHGEERTNGPLISTQWCGMPTSVPPYNNMPTLNHSPVRRVKSADLVSSVCLLEHMYLGRGAECQTQNHTHAR